MARRGRSEASAPRKHPRHSPVRPGSRVMATPRLDPRKPGQAPRPSVLTPNAERTKLPSPASPRPRSVPEAAPGPAHQGLGGRLWSQHRALRSVSLAPGATAAGSRKSGHHLPLRTPGTRTHSRLPRDSPTHGGSLYRVSGLPMMPSAPYSPSAFHPQYSRQLSAHKLQHSHGKSVDVRVSPSCRAMSALPVC